MAAGFGAGLLAIVSLGGVQGPNDPMATLLGEVHALRVAIERQTAIGTRVQLTLSRLTVAEQRVTRLTDDLNTIQQEIENVDSMRRSFAADVASLERSLQAEWDPAKRSSYERQIESLKRVWSDQTAVEERLRSRESATLQALTEQQNLTVDLKTRLDECDRLIGAIR